MNILSLEAITKQFAERPLLDAAALGVEAGEHIGVVGVNGSGKTTLLRIVAGLEQADSGVVSMTRGLRVAYLPQNPPLDPAITVLEQVFRSDAPEMRLLHDYERASMRLAQAPHDATLQASVHDLVAQLDAAGAWALENDARTILSKLGITDLQALVGTLSGGQRKRVAMAAALIAPADLLILDEPTNHIDTDTVAWLETFLARAAAAVLLVTHDRYFLDRVVGRIVEVDRGKLYSYSGNYSRFLELKAERAAQQATGEARRQTILKKELVWLARGAQARTTKQQARIDRIDAMQTVTVEHERGTIDLSVAARRLGKRVIELKDVSKSFGPRPLVRGLSLEVGGRERLGIIGPNGQGKTTLLNMIAGRITPDTGSIVVGETVHMAYYDQESAGLNEAQRVIDYVRDGAELVQTADGSVITAAQMLERFLFAPAAQYTPIARLSGGERRRLYLLRKLMDAPNVLLLDEPTNDLDIQTLGVLEDYLDDFAGALVVVSHDRYFLDRTVGQLLAFEGDGAVVQYPGAYSFYAAVQAQRAADTAPAPRTPPKAAEPKNEAKPRKLSFKEQRELGELEQRIAALEAEQAAVQTQINGSSSDYQAVQRLALHLDQLGAALEAAFERWTALAELAEQSRA